MEKTLQLVFKNADGGSKTISVSDPREDVTAAEAQEAMQTILDNNIFDTTGGDLTEAVEARVRTVDVVVLA